MVLIIFVVLYLFLLLLLHLLPHKSLRDPPADIPTPIYSWMQLQVRVIATVVCWRRRCRSHRKFLRLELGPPIPPHIVLGLPLCFLLFWGQRELQPNPPEERRRGGKCICRRWRWQQWHRQRLDELDVVVVASSSSFSPTAFPLILLFVVGGDLDDDGKSVAVAVVTAVVAVDSVNTVDTVDTSADVAAAANSTFLPYDLLLSSAVLSPPLNFLAYLLSSRVGNIDPSLCIFFRLRPTTSMEYKTADSFKESPLSPSAASLTPEAEAAPLHLLMGDPGASLLRGGTVLRIVAPPPLLSNTPPIPIPPWK